MAKDSGINQMKRRELFKVALASAGAVAVPFATSNAAAASGKQTCATHEAAPKPAYGIEGQRKADLGNGDVRARQFTYRGLPPV
jgi:xylan 1,4-beta-xylosidase